jgi:hypothetical protein
MPRMHTRKAGRDPRGHCQLKDTGFSLTCQRYPYIAEAFSDEVLAESAITRDFAEAFERRLGYLYTNKHQRWERGTLVMMALRCDREVPPEIVRLAVKLHDWAHEAHGFCIAGPHTEEKEYLMREGLDEFGEGTPPAEPFHRRGGTF